MNPEPSGWPEYNTFVNWYVLLQLAHYPEGLPGPAFHVHFAVLFPDMKIRSQSWKLGNTWDYVEKKREIFESKSG